MASGVGVLDVEYSPGCSMHRTDRLALTLPFAGRFFGQLSRNDFRLGAALFFAANPSAIELFVPGGYAALR